MKLTQARMDMYFEAVAQPQSTYALTHFVDGGQLTPERRFKQAVMELNASQRGLRDTQFTLEELQIDFLEVQDRLLADEPPKDYTVYDRKRDKVKARRLEFDIGEVKLKLRGLEREMQVHLDLLHQYHEELGFHADTTLDDVIQRLEAAESDHYVTKLALDAAAHLLMAKGGPHMGVLTSMQQLPPEDIAKIGPMADKLMANMMERRYTEALHSAEGVKALQDQGSDLKLSSNPGVEMPSDPKVKMFA